MKKLIILLLPIMSYGQISLNTLTCTKSNNDVNHNIYVQTAIVNYNPRNVVTKIVRTPSNIFSNRTEYTTTVYHTIENIPTITVIRSSSKAANDLNYQINNIGKYSPNYTPMQIFK